MKATCRRLLLGLVFLCLYGCTAVVTTPPVDANRSVEVYLLDHGRHASLVLPDRDRAIRYAYGDWKYYALAEPSLQNGIRAILFPTQGALGRKIIPWPLNIVQMRQHIHVFVENMYVITVARDEVDLLLSDLEGIYRSDIDSRIHNAAYDLTFVHYPVPYSALNTSNDVVADWLRRLGCTVRGRAVFSHWQVKTSEHKPLANAALGD